MIPWTHYKAVVVSLILLFECFICMKGSEAIFSVKKSAHDQGGRLDVVKVVSAVPGFPEIIVGTVCHKFVPEFHRIREVPGLNVFKRFEFLIELVIILCVIFKRFGTLVGLYRPGAGNSE